MPSIFTTTVALVPKPLPCIWIRVPPVLGPNGGFIEVTTEVAACE